MANRDQNGDQSIIESDVQIYEVLWTSQITQKSKRWNDGILKFHIFNKRAMLYDLNKVLVDSSFLTSVCNLQVNQELKLERHLVLIEHAVQTIRQDITPIIRRKRKSSIESPLKLPFTPLQPSRLVSNLYHTSNHTVSSPLIRPYVPPKPLLIPHLKSLKNRTQQRIQLSDDNDDDDDYGGHGRVPDSVSSPPIKKNRPSFNHSPQKSQGDSIKLDTDYLATLSSLCLVQTPTVAVTPLTPPASVLTKQPLSSSSKLQRRKLLCLGKPPQRTSR
ncbi:hypothetical protein V1514DRAFT_319486 [Lipomyces japonicus]|uniref:uncharacterized protein n=1 Tax=Lipomyces japonicus TaxID=56871 RepID=UPI0034CE25D9